MWDVPVQRLPITWMACWSGSGVTVQDPLPLPATATSSKRSSTGSLTAGLTPESCQYRMRIFCCTQFCRGKQKIADNMKWKSM
jgi:hypothetical protein